MSNVRSLPTVGPREPLKIVKGMTIGRYVVERGIGSGGMGQIWLAHDESLGREVAIKVMSDAAASNSEFCDRFRQEARLLIQAEHPGIVRVIDAGNIEGRPYYVMERLHGRDLSDTLADLPDAKLPYKRALSYLITVGQAMAYVHRRGLIHRDLKPENIFLDVDADGAVHPKVIDFGLGKQLLTDVGLAVRSRKHMTATHMSFGTPHYMSPEQSEASKNADARSDIYALAAILFEMVVGTPPYDDPHDPGSDLQVMSRHKMWPTPSAAQRNPEIPRWLDKVITKGLQKLPEDRYQTMDELVAALEAGLKSEEHMETLPSPPRREPVPIWLVLLVLGIGIATTAGLGLRVFLHRSQPHQELAARAVVVPSRTVTRSSVPAPPPVIDPPIQPPVVVPAPVPPAPLVVLEQRDGGSSSGHHHRHHADASIATVVSPPLLTAPEEPCGQLNAQGVLVPCFH